MALKIEKLNGIIQRELSSIIQKEVKDPKVGFCTVVDVDVSRDYSIAKVYVTFLGRPRQQDEGLEALKRSSGYIRSLLSKRLTIRRCPELRFLLDTSLSQGNKIETILKDIQQKEK